MQLWRNGFDKFAESAFGNLKDIRLDKGHVPRNVQDLARVFSQALSITAVPQAPSALKPSNPQSNRG